jgi:hypothetical protein
MYVLNITERLKHQTVFVTFFKCSELFRAALYELIFVLHKDVLFHRIGASKNFQITPLLNTVHEYGLKIITNVQPPVSMTVTREVT